MSIPKAIFCWSGGKDSAYCLHKVLSERTYDVRYLLTTINDKYKRISMHGVREELLEKQAKAIGIELLKVTVSEGTNNEYENQMEMILLKARAEGISHVIYGDIFLEELRVYREKNLEKVQMQGVFPLWKLDTKWLVTDFLAKGFKTITCCINDEHLNEEWAGRKINTAFVNQLPVAVDPCGENGEFHTFCYEGPLFRKKILFSTGEKVYKPIEEKTEHVFTSPSNTKGFWFCDLIPV
ncbi:MAG: diphthine--ammonia ligase [Bacteroidetes bacterium]|nr:diphthine--ammonia ligase [Bacteroidota bacterium]